MIIISYYLYARFQKYIYNYSFHLLLIFSIFVSYFFSFLTIFTTPIIILRFSYFPSSLTHFSFFFHCRMFFSWATGSGRPASGSLIQLVTSGGKTESTPVRWRHKDLEKKIKMIQRKLILSILLYGLKKVEY